MIDQISSLIFATNYSVPQPAVHILFIAKEISLHEPDTFNKTICTYPVRAILNE